MTIIASDVASILNTYAQQTADDCECDRVTALSHMAENLSQVVLDTQLDRDVVSEWLKHALLACIEVVDPRLAGWIGCFV